MIWNFSATRNHWIDTTGHIDNHWKDLDYQIKLYFHLFERSTTFNMQKQGHIFLTFFHLKDPKTVTRYSPVLSIRAPWSVLIYRGAAISIGASKRVSSITSIPPCRVNQQEICYDQILWGIPIYDQWEEVSPWWNIMLFLVQNGSEQSKMQNLYVTWHVGRMLALPKAYQAYQDLPVRFMMTCLEHGKSPLKKKSIHDMPLVGCLGGRHCKGPRENKSFLQPENRLKSWIFAP